MSIAVSLYSRKKLRDHPIGCGWTSLVRVSLLPTPQLTIPWRTEEVRWDIYLEH